MIKVSILIPSYNGRDLLKKHLPEVVAACQNWGKAGWEILVVDDASTDDSRSFLKTSYPRVRLISHKTNQRFAVSCNTGFKFAKGEIVVLLNNDVSPEKNFLKPLLVRFEDPLVFAVGCREIDFKENKPFLSGRGEMKFKRGLVVHWRADDQGCKTTHWAAGGSSAFSRDKWLALRGMDTLFRPAYEEDRDISYRALKHGWKIFFEPESVVFHHHETTNIKIFGEKKIKIVSFKNQFLFVWKNITDFKYILQHILWLPYHLVFTGLKTRGLLTLGFLLALRQLPEALKSRIEVKRLFVKKDKELI